jgi:2-dehydro-3-deoxyphosphogluconate aldolase/(4S)-4-hydroxy-2-oxoglutarate aldolase
LELNIYLSLLFPLGGINLDNIASDVEAGLAYVAVESYLLDKNLIDEFDFDGNTETSNNYIAAVKKPKK